MGVWCGVREREDGEIKAVQGVRAQGRGRGRGRGQGQGQAEHFIVNHITFGCRLHNYKTLIKFDKRYYKIL